MAGITIQGIKVTSVDITRDDKGMLKATGKYELMGSNGVALARQGFNGYQDIQISPSPATQRSLNDVVANIVNDVNAILGLE